MLKIIKTENKKLKLFLELNIIFIVFDISLIDERCFYLCE